MLAVKGYIDGNTVVAIDDGLNNFTGTELLIRIVEKPQNVHQQPEKNKSERINALHAIQGVLKGCKPTTIEQIHEERLGERYGL